jgi:hypothetical protein
MKTKFKQIITELKHHAPFTATATLVAVLMVVIFLYLFNISIPERIFHAFHYSHLVVSAVVTAGIFYKYRPKFILALLIGVTGAVLIGSLSDVLFPFLISSLLGLEVHFHLPLLEETFVVLFFAFAGSLFGALTKVTKTPHFLHVFLSVFASLFYLLVYSSSFLGFYFIFAFFIVFIAVIIPCCLSDIVYPLLFVSSKQKDVE